MLRTPCCSKPSIMPCFAGFYQPLRFARSRPTLLKSHRGTTYNFRDAIIFIASYARITWATGLKHSDLRRYRSPYFKKCWR